MNRSILYVGSLEASCNSYGRYKALERLGNQLTGIDTTDYIYNSLFAKLHHHLNVGPGIIALNKVVMNSLEENTTDILWVDNKPFLTEPTLRKIKNQWPSLKIINLITDDPAGKYKSAWRLALQTAKYYNMHFVQRAINVPELKNFGARNVEICYRSYDPYLHRPMKPDTRDKKKYKVPVGFIGTYESFREEYVVYLIDNGIPVSITGNDWEKAKHWKIIKPYYNGPSVYGEAYPKVINGFDIGLHFLRHTNRDEQDSRTFEIPACGTFMLAEKSDVHLSLFEADKEAVFFESKDELLEKVRYYLLHDNEREAIARAGYERCVSSRYSHEERLKEVLQKIFE